jgi:hypothetical protein
MATEQGGSGAVRPWHTNQNNSVTPATAGPSEPTDGRELPTPEERIAEFYAEYADRAYLPLTNSHGRRLRKEFTEEVRERFEADAPREWDDPVSGEEVVRHEPLSWGHAVAELLHSHEDTRRTTVNLERGRPGDADYAEFSVDADTRWCASYQRKYYAQLKAWLRELTGGERPSGGSTDATMDNPKIALLTRSASATPDGDHVSPVDHAAELSEAWDSVYHTLRNTMRSLGYDWQYDRRLEPHDSKRGGGANACYGHEHVVIVVDGDVSASDFRPIVEKHVEDCEWAGETAHDLDVTDWDLHEEEVNTVEVKDPEEMENLAAYVASYAGIRPVDLLERDTEYIAWAATMNAANVRTKSRSDAAKHAASADSCKQRYESGEADQSVNHAENIVSSDRRGYDWECSECGSPHGIEQDRDDLDDDRDGHYVGTDTTQDDDADDTDENRDDLRSRWPSARSAISVGESIERAELRSKICQFLEVDPGLSNAELFGKLNASVHPDELEEVAEQVRNGIDSASVESFERPLEWAVKSVSIGDKEFPANAGTGIEMVEVDLPVQAILEQTELGDPEAESTYWRCDRTNVAMYGGRSMAAYLVKHGITAPEIAEQCCTAERGPLAE